MIEKKSSIHKDVFLLVPHIKFIFYNRKDKKMIYYVNKESDMWLGLSDSFWGALLGAGISGLFAVGVLIIGKILENNNKKQLFNNVKWLVKFVHLNIEEKLQKYISDAEAGKEMSEEVHKSINDILNYSLYLEQIDFNEIIGDTNVLTNVIQYKSALNNINKIIKHDDYGFLFVKHLSNDKTNETRLDMVKKMYKQMNESIKELR